jgi:hypothetical protein
MGAGRAAPRAAAMISSTFRTDSGASLVERALLLCGSELAAKPAPKENQRLAKEHSEVAQKAEHQRTFE